MSDRMTRFHAYKDHTVHRPLFERLSKAEREACEAFIRDNDHLDVNAFAHKVNRWHLDKPKPKHYVDMWALVLQANTRS